MTSKYFTLGIVSLMVLAACQQKEEKKTDKKAAAVSVCRHAAVPNQLHDDLQAAIVSEAQKYIQNDAHQFVDIDKMTSAASQLKLSINGIQDKESQCRGKVSIVIPQNIQKVAQVNAPLVGITQYDTIIEERMGSENFQFNGSTLTLPINFTVKSDPISITQSDSAFQTAATALTAALLPYGVKDNIHVAGRIMTRDMALQAMKMNGGKLPVAPPPAPTPRADSNDAPPASSTPSSTANTTNTAKVNEKRESRVVENNTPHTPPKAVVEKEKTVVETAEQKALREAKAAEAAAKLAAEKAAQRAAKAKAAREAAEAAKLKQAEVAKNTHANTNADAPKLTPKAPKTPKVERVEKAEKSGDTAKLTPKRPAEATISQPAENSSLTPKVERKARVSDDELDKVRKAHSQADQEIKSSWKKITPDIQKELVEEQKSWERQRNQRCRQAAAAGADESEANKLYMQCDTRMTKERVKSLNGYSIQ